MKFDLVLWANSGDQIQNRTQYRTKRERMYVLRDAFCNALHLDGKSWAPNFNLRSPNHSGRVKKGVNISPRHSTNPVMFPNSTIWPQKTFTF